MTYKIGTLKELEEVKEKIPADIYNKIHEIVSMLDREYGADRNVEENDGGYV
jgi:type III secretion system FlhB-like substrate exporter